MDHPRSSINMAHNRVNLSTLLNIFTSLWPIMWHLNFPFDFRKSIVFVKKVNLKRIYYIDNRKYVSLYNIIIIPFISKIVWTTLWTIPMKLQLILQLLNAIKFWMQESTDRSVCCSMTPTDLSSRMCPCNRRKFSSGDVIYNLLIKYYFKIEKSSISVVLMIF